MTLPHSSISKSIHLAKSNHVDLGSPKAFNESFKKSLDAVGVDEVQIVVSSKFSERCVKFMKKTNEAYNQLQNLSSTCSMSVSHKKNEGVKISPEVFIIPDPGGAAYLKAAQKRNVPVVSKVSDHSTVSQHVPRRVVGAARHNSDPYVQQLNRFPVTLQQRKHYSAINQIGSHEVWCKYEDVRYDRAFYSYHSLSTQRPDGHLDNFLILCFCRFLFNQSHPSKSKKHFFFSYIGESILNFHVPNISNPEIVRNAFEGANSAFLMWRSSFLYFPIGLNGHWFSFVVCIKDRAFVFLDPAFGENSHYHQNIRDVLIQNFIMLWDTYVTPMMHKRIDFEEFDVLYPAVPKQDNRHDCGVFTLKYMEIFTPRTQMANLFSSADIPSLRVKYANDLFFSPLNSCDKSLVTEFFGGGGNQ